MTKRRNLLLVALALAGIATNGVVAVANSDTWNVDFNQFYAAGTLAGSGHLYDWPSLRALELAQGTKAIAFVRIPIFALAFKPFSALPHALARLLWLGACIGALGGFVALWPLPHRLWACVVVCWSAPVAMCLAFGQDTTLFLFCAALGLRLLLSGRDFWAGVALSVCVAKPHLALLLPALLVAKLKWRALLGGLAGGVALVLASFAVEGTGWVSGLLALMCLPEFYTAPQRMPNLRGLLWRTGADLPGEIALGLTVVVALWFVSRRLPLPSGMALALACGLMVSHHAYVYDAVVLFPAILLSFDGPYPAWLREWAVVICTPLPFLLFMTNLELVAQLAVTGYTAALMAATAYELRYRSAHSLAGGFQAP